MNDDTEIIDNQSKTELIENKAEENRKLFDGKELSAGTILQDGKYSIEHVIGTGGFGITYLAKHNALGHSFAVKEFFIGGSCVRDTASKTVLLQGIDSEAYDRYLQKFVEEAQTLARLDHSNIVKVTDIFRENNTAYMVMTFVKGDTLQQRIEQSGRLNYETAAGYIVQLTEAAAYLHHRDILHRDIKPENIIITPGNKVILIDFGSAREFVHNKTQSHTSILTHGYAPLEQYSANSKRGAYSDIYSLGAVFYFMLTGQKPMDATTRTMEAMPEPKKLAPEIPAAANRAILKAMELKPENRYQRVSEFVTDLSSKEKPHKETTAETNYIVKHHQLSVYHSVFWLIMILAGGAGFGIPSAILSIVLLFYCWGTKGFKSIVSAFKLIWIIIPSIIAPVVMIEINDRGQHDLFGEQGAIALLVLAAYIFFYVFFALGRQLKMINGLETKILHKILNVLILFFVNITVGIIIPALTFSLVVAIIFMLKPHYLHSVVPVIGLVLILIFLFGHYRKQIKQYSKFFIVSSAITLMLSVLIWLKDIQYDSIGSYSDGLALATRETWHYEWNNTYATTKYGFVNPQKKAIIPLKYDEADLFSEGFAKVGIGCYLYYRKYGFVNMDGIEVIPLKYHNVKSFSEGLAAVIYRKWGFIDTTGKEVVPLKYDYVESFSEGLAAVKGDGKWGFVDKTGKEIIPLKYENVQSFSNGRALVTVEETKERKGRNYINGKDGFKLPDWKDYVGNIYFTKRSFYIDRNGQEIIEENRIIGR